MRRQGFWHRWWWLAVLIVFDVFFVIWWIGCNRQEKPAGVELSAIPVAAEPAPPVVVPPLWFGFPTAQTNLVRVTDESVFMPTAAGRVESAHYGSVRTQNVGGRILPSFHEGIDIAPLQRDRRGRAMDPVLAVADGTVVYANRQSGNSNYGIYVVLEHSDPVGAIYTLYAHLSTVDKAIREGTRVTRGTVLGVLGNTPSATIPVPRSHLHLEVGMIRNRRFSSWAAGQKIDNQHGNYNGWNMTGINPLALYPTPDPEREFSMLDYLNSQPVAVELLIQIRRPLDYFKRYPVLWRGGSAPEVGLLVLAISDGGVILHGRPPTETERAQHTAARLPVVLSADAGLLGRNGLRIAVQRNGRWEPGSGTAKWLDILTH